MNRRLQEQELRLLKSGLVTTTGPAGTTATAVATDSSDKDEILRSIAAVRKANERELTVLKDAAKKQQAEKQALEKQLAEHVEALAQMKRKLLAVAEELGGEMVKVKGMCGGMGISSGGDAQKEGMGAETGEGEGRDGEADMMVE